MKGTKLTPQEKQFVIENYLNHTQRELAKALGRSKSAVVKVMRDNNLKVPLELANKRRAKANSNKTTSTPQIDQYLRENYLKINVKQIAVNIEKSGTFVSTRLRQLRLKIPREIIEARKAKNQFKPGQESYNKGKRQSEYMTTEQIEVTKKTRFKKGIIPHNTLPEGSEIIRDHRSCKLLMIKVPGKRKLVYKHRHIWEQHHGKIPKGHNIIFKDGNTLNCEIENLKCVTDAELMSKNTFHNYPEHIKELIYLKGSITRQINKHKKPKSDGRINSQKA